VRARRRAPSLTCSCAPDVWCAQAVTGAWGAGALLWEAPELGESVEDSECDE
jgi:hypothetical protein